MSEIIGTTDTSGLSRYWDRYASGMTSESREKALKDAFGWCQYEGHGPGDELLGDVLSTLELGFGRGNAVAALATKGIEATGVDVSPLQREQAAAQWGDLSGATFVRADVCAYLADTSQSWDAIYSIWGALWFTDPDRLLPLIRERLSPGGRLVFSHAPPVPGSYGVQGMYGGGFTGRRTWVYRWAYEPETWAAILGEHGFADIDARVHPAPEADLLGTLIVIAHRSP
ncbi:SAM-dependent methyltransferase [Lipingzhangella halophila]|uniref:SAM-dependent methyltransferase n=1 Tax=Lipingzhangella halophila TaxID=1783352 RepID=A0A7W7RK15_9ACTN|nr:class I SAM-dependent methyltransferase [Lipingzhangella halophila]MBB4933399.1 SAM-dependent methyltransferase [Lipingzhangella halophila]